MKVTRTGRHKGVAGGVSSSKSALSTSGVGWQDLGGFTAAVNTHVYSLAHSPVLAPVWTHLGAWYASVSTLPCMPAGALPRLHLLGLGSPSTSGVSSSALVQLAFFVVLSRLVKACWEGGGGTTPMPHPKLLSKEVGGCVEEEGLSGVPWAHAMDPCFTPKDMVLLASLGLHASSDPRDLGLPATTPFYPSLYFMPHCPGALYSAILARFSWGGEGAPPAAAAAAGAAAAATGVDLELPLPPLPALCLIGNSFSAYVERREGGEMSKNAFPVWSPCLRGRVQEGATQALLEGEESFPPLALDGVVAVARRCSLSWKGCDRGGEKEEEGGRRRVWGLRETPLEGLVAERSREVLGTSPAYQQALSTTSVHTVHWE